MKSQCCKLLHFHHYLSSYSILHLQPKAEYDSLCRNLGERNIPEDRQALSEIKEYTVKDEGAWALSDETIHFIGKPSGGPFLHFPVDSVFCIVRQMFALVRIPSPLHLLNSSLIDKIETDSGL